MFYVGSRRLPGGRKVEFHQEGCSNTVSYKEIIDGFSSDCGRAGEKCFDGEITKKGLHEYMKSVQEDLREPL